MHGVDDRVDADEARHLERGQVERLAKRLTEGERSVLLLRRVLGRIGLAAPVLHRELDVVEPAGCSEAELLHAGEVREELERRARLAKRDPGVVIVALHLRRVDVVVVAPDVGEDLAGRWIHRDERRVVHVIAVERVDVVLDLFLGQLLHVPVERRVDVIAAAVGGLLAENVDELLAHAEGEMRRVQRRRGRRHLDRLALGRVCLRLRGVAVVDHGVQHLGAPGHRRGHVLDWVVVRRRLREAGEKRHLREGELVQVGNPEVGGRRRLETVGLVPVVDLVEVHLEDLLLAEGPRRLDREDRLFDLSREGRVVAEKAGLDELLGDRGSALRDPTTRGVRLERADDAADVDTRVRPEGLVLDRDRGVLHPLGNRIERDQLALLVGEGVKQMLSGPVVDVGSQGDGHGREVVRCGQISREVADHGGDADPDEGGSGEEGRAQDPREGADRSHRADAAGHAPTAALREAVGTVRPPGRDSLDGHLPYVTSGCTVRAIAETGVV